MFKGTCIDDYTIIRDHEIEMYSGSALVCVCVCVCVCIQGSCIRGYNIIRDPEKAFCIQGLQ